VRNVVDWNALNMNFDLKAKIDPETCIECGRCHIACEDTSHQAIRFDKLEDGGRRFTVIDDECVGCNLCQIVCPVPECISMVPVANNLPPITWPEHPDNPLRVGACT
jgi:dihydropyrimidine dehydrogenase (NAD+) subunit PreA